MIKLRALSEEDLEKYHYWKLPQHKYHELNGPYFRKSTAEEVKKEIEELRKKFQADPNHAIANKQLISNDKNEVLGEVSWYWKSEETNWLEIGIVLFDPKTWGQGIGYVALKDWIEKVFEMKPEIVRLGLSTWSGNAGMIKLAQKLGMKQEAVYRKARIVHGSYYDSVSYGVLREEWGSN